MTTTVKKSTKATSTKATFTKASAAKTPVLEAAPKLTPLEAAKAKKKPKTILEEGLTYSLLTRVRNSFNKNLWAKMEKGSNMLTMIDGRGTEQKISEIYIQMAKDLGGAKYLSSVRSSHVRRALREKGVAVK